MDSHLTRVIAVNLRLRAKSSELKKLVHPLSRIIISSLIVNRRYVRALVRLRPASHLGRFHHHRSSSSRIGSRKVDACTLLACEDMTQLHISQVFWGIRVRFAPQVSEAWLSRIRREMLSAPLTSNEKGKKVGIISELDFVDSRLAEASFGLGPVVDVARGSSFRLYPL